MRTVGLLAALAATVLLAGSAAAQPVATGVTWRLVKTTECAAPKKVVGLACWDQSGSLFTDKWQVGPSSATLNTPGWDLNYKYDVLDIIPAEGGRSLQLTATVTSRDPAGISGQVCIASGFTSGDTCARASAPGAGQSNTGSKKVLLTPYRAADGASATLIVALGDGGRLYFTYKAEPNVAESNVEEGPGDYRVTFRFTSLRHSKAVDLLTAGRGTATITVPPRKNLIGGTYPLKAISGLVAHEVNFSSVSIGDTHLRFGIVAGTVQIGRDVNHIVLALALLNSDDKECPDTARTQGGKTTVRTGGLTALQHKPGSLLAFDSVSLHIAACYRTGGYKNTKVTINVTKKA